MEGYFIIVSPTKVNETMPTVDKARVAQELESSILFYAKRGYKTHVAHFHTEGEAEYALYVAHSSGYTGAFRDGKTVTVTW